MPADRQRAEAEVARLSHDAELVRRTLETQLAGAPPTADTSEETTFLRVTFDLWRKIIQHCNVTSYLLHHEIAEPAAVVYRAAYETMVTLAFILSRPTRKEQVEAALSHVAYSRLEIVKWFPDHPSADTAKRALARMPADLVAAARRNHEARRPRGPFGLSLKQTAEAAGVEGHDWNYTVLSWEGHARIAGDNVEQGKPDATGLRNLRFVRQVDPEWTWALANQARRFLHRIYEAVARVWLGTIPPLQTTNPHEEPQ